MFKQQGDVLKLTRATPTESWMLDGLKEATEELTSARVDEIVGVLDELKIAGVRPKFKYKGALLLTADLKLNVKPDFEENQREFGAAIDRLQAELDQKGFNLAGSEKKLELVSKYGELTIGTDKGVQYTLHIGNPVEGDETEIEIGSSSSNDAADKEDAAKGDTKDQKADEKTDSQTEAKTGEQKSGEGEAKEEEEVEVDNRYLLVRVGLDRSLINPQPEKPTEPAAPVAPEGYQPPKEPEAKDETPDTETPDTEAPVDVEAPEGVESPEGETKDETPKQDDRKPEFVAHDQALQAFEAAKVQYELDLTRFEDESKAFEEKVAEGQKLVDELNERFGDWYYVMSADNLNTLRTRRIDLVTKKQPAPGSEPAPPVRPDISFPDLPIGVPGGAGEKAPMVEGEPETTATEVPKAKDPQAKDAATEKAMGDKPEVGGAKAPGTDGASAEKSAVPKPQTVKNPHVPEPAGSAGETESGPVGAVEAPKAVEVPQVPDAVEVPETTEVPAVEAGG